MNEVIRFERVRKVFEGRVEALKGVDLSIKRGEFVGIMGPSGSGKSTLLHLMGGIEKPTEGRIFIDGIDITKLSEDELAELRRKRISYIFQFFYLLQDFTCIENLTVVGRIGGIRNPEERAKEILKRIGLEEKAYDFPSNLSGGQQQRLAIGRALMIDAEIIIGDEPTGNLDRQNAESVFNLFKEINEERGATIIIATHNDSLKSYFGRIIHLEDGKIT